MPKGEFSGSQKGGGEEGRWGRRGTRPEGEKGGKNEGKRVGEERDLKAQVPQNSDFGTPMIYPLTQKYYLRK